MIERSSFLTAVAAFGSLAAAAPSRVLAADTLTVAFIPEVATTPSSYAAKQPLVDMLARATKRAVKLVIPTNYAATVEAVGNDSVDLAYFGGLTYLKARKLYGVVPLVQREADRQFHSLFITGRPQITKLADLRGKSFAFGDVNSTSGHLQPVKEMLDAGIDPDKDLQTRYTGNHTATAIAVNGGSVDAGAIDETVYRKLVDDKQIDPAKARDLANQVDKLVWAEGFSLPLTQSPGNVAVRGTLANFGAFGLADADYTKIGFMKP